MAERGSRPRLDKHLVALLSPEAEQVHLTAIEMADKHVAHRVASHEQAQVIAFLQPVGAEPGLDSIQTLALVHAGPMKEFAADLAAVCAAFREVLDHNMTVVTKELVDHFEAEADFDQLYAQSRTGSEIGGAP